MNEYEIIFYEDKNGNSETFNYFKKISQSKQKQNKAIYIKMRHQINMLRALGPMLHTPQSKKLKGYRYQLWELRPMPERVFYGIWKENTFILLNHYTKKKDKTDPKQVAKALSMLDDWYERNEEK
ncbi:type II toxin-antitoxin system RelE/ParE family toxin [Limosilactobacillus sp.]|uniref:type II toxin-antitoxin system RelE/ParE family toxin n=1 Tax=Limosilactobacillus sp. TaxID=2773925 RepID=UPI00359F53DE